MADLFSGMDCRLRKSMKDSVMMNSLFMAMNKAHEKLKSRQGVIGRLIEISKFYELAVMQLDGCLKIVEEETDSLSLEVNHEEMMSDLYMIRDRLQRRLDDTELTIMNTDGCLAERFENELKLREALDMKEKELISLQGDLDQLERTKSEGHQVLSKNLKNQVSGVDDGKEGDISQLKNSVDMKFCSFKQMFEERKFSVESSQIDQLSSDIDRLKESLDLAFGKMQNAIFLSAVEPAEHEWRWSIEKDVMLISAKGLTDDFHDIHEPTVWKLNYFSLLMNEIRSLRSEFEQLMREKETAISPSPSVTDFWVKIPSGTKERPPLDNKKAKNDERVKTEQADHIEEEGGNYVAKLISTHERIIQKKIEEQRAKERLIRERWYSAMKKDKQPDGLNKKIHDVIARLDSIINMNPPPSKTLGEVREDIVKPKPLRRFSSESEIEFRNISSSSMFCQVDDDVIGQIRILEMEKEELKIQALILEDVHTIILRDWINQCYHDFDIKIEQIFITMRMLEKETENCEAKSMMLEEACKKFEMENEELRRKRNILEQENKDFEGQSTILEDIYAVLLTSLSKEHRSELEKMSASKALLEEMVDKFTEDVIATNIDLQTSTTVLRDKMKDTNNTDFSVLAEVQEILMNGLSGKIQQKAFAILFQGLFHELTKYIENFDTENLVRQETYRVVLEETIRDVLDTHTSKQSEWQEKENSKEPSTSLVENDEGINAFLEMVKEWKMNQIFERLISEDIYQFVVKEAAKDAYTLSRTSEDSLSGENLINKLENREDSFIQRLDYMLKCLESEQELDSSEITEIVEQNSFMDQNSTRYPELRGIDAEGSMEDVLLVDDEIDFSSVRRKFEDALHQLYTSRKLITELRFDLGMDIDQAAPDVHTISHEDGAISLVTTRNLHKNKKLITDLKSSSGIYIDQAPSRLDSISDEEDSVHLPEESDWGAELSQSFGPSMLFAVSEVLKEFEQTVYMKLDSTLLRLEATKHHLTPLSNQVGSLQKNEALYKNAFMRRCHDLHLAETEVDLLGDQVDSLLTLLEKIYWTLYRHSPALRQNSEVQELMNMIKKETNLGSIINPS